MEVIWTDERIALLTEMAKDRTLTYAAMGRRLGVSRCAAMAKAHRLGVAEARPRSTGESSGKPSAPRAVKMQPPKLVFEAPEPEPSERVTALTVNDRTCRWPLGDPRNPEFHFCGRKPVLGKSYCAEHMRKAFQPPQPRRIRS